MGRDGDAAKEDKKRRALRKLSVVRYGAWRVQQAGGSGQQTEDTRHQGVSCPWSVVRCEKGIEHREEIANCEFRIWDCRAGHRTGQQKKIPPYSPLYKRGEISRINKKVPLS
jgi:hypothetical protein